MKRKFDTRHPMLKRLQEVVQGLDPGRRFIPTSPSGPRADANPADFGKGLHWDVHGSAALSPLQEARYGGKLPPKAGNPEHNQHAIRNQR